MLSTNNTDSPKKHPDFREILLSRHDEHNWICISAYKIVNGKFVVSERFCNGVDEAANLIERSYLREDIGAIWTNIQRLKPGSSRRKKGETIDAYINIVIDIDRKIKKDADGNKVNATDEERVVLREAAEEVHKLLAKYFGAAVFADSGNGYHLSWRCEPLEPKEGHDLYRQLLGALCAKFERDGLNMEIDLSLADDTQVVTVWGTWNRKYADTLDRPQRQSKALLLPPQKPITRTDILLAIVENEAPPATQKPTTKKSAKTDKLKANSEWLEEHGVPHLIDFWSGHIAYEEESYDKGGDTHHPIAPCPCHESEDLHEHSHAKDCEIIEFADGGIGISCFSRDFGLKTVIAKMNGIVGEKYPHMVYAEERVDELLEEFGAVENEEIAGVLPMAIALPAVAEIAIPIAEKKPSERVFAKGGLNPADFKPGRVVPCEICGRGCFKSEMIGHGDRCLDHTEAAMELAELTREESEDEAVAPTMTEETLPQEPETKEFALVEGTNSKEDVLRIYGILASDIEPEPLEWLWQDKIPAGKITLFAGQPDCGKTIAMLDIVARVTKGEKFPDGSENTLGPRRVLLAATEDDLESTLVPRLMAAGADMTKVVILKRVEIERAKGSKHKTERRILQLKADAKLLRYMLKKNPDIALVALDPISSYFGDADPNKDKEIRPVMEAVAEACDQSGVSFVAIIHNNKRGDADAIGKILGASSVVGVSRAVWGFAHDPEDTDKKYMTLVKGNLARNRKGMKYRIADATVVIKGKDRVLPRIEWMEETDASANDVLDMQRDSSGRKDAKKIDMIKLLLQKQLDETPGNAILLRDFYSLCEKERLGDGDKIKKTVQRAVKDIGATTAKPPNSKGPWWIMMDIDAHPWVGQFEADGKDSKGHEQPKGWLAEAI